MVLHGHDDGGSVTLYGYGRQLLVDPGYGDYNAIEPGARSSRRAGRTTPW